MISEFYIFLTVVAISVVITAVLFVVVFMELKKRSPNTGGSKD